jgi:hypothetical protein
LFVELRLDRAAGGERHGDRDGRLARFQVRRLPDLHADPLRRAGVELLHLAEFPMGHQLAVGAVDLDLVEDLLLEQELVDAREHHLVLARAARFARQRHREGAQLEPVTVEQLDDLGGGELLVVEPAEVAGEAGAEAEEDREVSQKRGERRRNIAGL